MGLRTRVSNVEDLHKRNPSRNGTRRIQRYYHVGDGHHKVQKNSKEDPDAESQQSKENKCWLHVSRVTWKEHEQEFPKTAAATKAYNTVLNRSIQRVLQAERIKFCAAQVSDGPISVAQSSCDLHSRYAAIMSGRVSRPSSASSSSS